jgi:hypothetical protein
MIYGAGFTEREAAEELSVLLEEFVSRDRVHTIHRAAIRTLRRRAELLAVA